MNLIINHSIACLPPQIASSVRTSWKSLVWSMHCRRGRHQPPTRYSHCRCKWPSCNVYNHLLSPMMTWLCRDFVFGITVVQNILYPSLLFLENAHSTSGLYNLSHYILHYSVSLLILRDIVIHPSVWCLFSFALAALSLPWQRYHQTHHYCEDRKTLLILLRLY